MNEEFIRVVLLCLAHKAKIDHAWNMSEHKGTWPWEGYIGEVISSLKATGLLRFSLNFVIPVEVGL